MLDGAFVWLMTALLVGAATHVARLRERRRDRVGEVLLRWILAGYCGIPMVAVAAWALAAPERTAAALGFPAGSPFQGFMASAYLGMAIAAVPAVRLAGPYLAGPALTWSVFFLGATFMHLHGVGHVHGGGARMAVLATHALVSALLLTGLALGGASARGGRAAER